MTLQEALAQQKRPKYGNRKIKTPDGEFDSNREYERWNELKLMQMAGAITDLKRQVKYELIPTQRDKAGKVLEEKVSYIADFDYWEISTHPAAAGVAMRHIVEDVKSEATKTRAYIIKRKLMLERYGIRIKEVE